MEAAILDDIITYLGDEVEEEDKTLLFILLNRAIRKVCAKRYPYGYTELEKIAAVERYRDTIFSAAVYYWTKQGADGESSHNENGINRAYEKEDEIFFDVVPMVTTL